MSHGVKIHLSRLPSGDIEFDVVRTAALGGSKPVSKFHLSDEEARHLYARIGEILEKDRPR